MEFRDLASDVGFTEGPVVLSNGLLAFTSIDRGRVYLHDGDTVRELAETGGGPNGTTEGPGGVLYVAQNGGKWPGKRTDGVTGSVQAIAQDGSVAVITMDLVSPKE